MANTLSNLLNKVYTTVGEAAKEYNEQDNARKLNITRILKGECESSLNSGEQAAHFQLKSETPYTVETFKTILKKGNKDEILDMFELYFKLREAYYEEIGIEGSNANIVDRYIRGEDVHDR